jgi:hypothetical protein
MSNILPACFIIAAFTLIGATTIERNDNIADAKELSNNSNPFKNLTGLIGQKNIGSWNEFVPNSSGWIEVDPSTGKPLIADLPQPTNLKAKPQRLTAEADS